jgi:exosome complex RNA-binding protein Rrp42 (RNase PH superfamily)
MRLSPPKLSYLYASLTSTPPLRPDLRPLTQYRPYSIQTDFLSTANGSARLTWGTGRQGGDVLVVIKSQINDSIELSSGIRGGKVSVDMYVLPSPESWSGVLIN